jgi:cell division protease FtsH
MGSRREVAEAVRHNRVLLEADLQRLQKRADETVGGHRGAVVAIAESLRSRRYLSGEAVRAIFAAHAPAGNRKRKGGQA